MMRSSTSFGRVGRVDLVGKAGRAGGCLVEVALGDFLARRFGGMVWVY